MTLPLTISHCMRFQTCLRVCYRCWPPGACPWAVACLLIRVCLSAPALQAPTTPPPSARATPHVRATANVVTAPFGTVSYFALHKYAPFLRATVGVVSVNFGILVLLSELGGGGDGTRETFPGLCPRCAPAPRERLVLVLPPAACEHTSAKQSRCEILRLSGKFYAGDQTVCVCVGT